MIIQEGSRLRLRGLCARCHRRNAGMGQGGDVFFEPDNYPVQRFRLCTKHFMEALAFVQHKLPKDVVAELEEFDG